MTDCEFVLKVLQDGRPHSLNDILRRSFAERGCGLTVHSRVAELRKRGHLIQHERVQGARRGDSSAYRLVPAPEFVIGLRLPKHPGWSVKV